MKQPESGRECPVSDIVHDGTPQVTATADARAKDNHGYAAAFTVASQAQAMKTLPGVPRP